MGWKPKDLANILLVSLYFRSEGIKEEAQEV